MMDCSFSSKTYDDMIFREYRIYKDYYGILETWKEVMEIFKNWIPPLSSPKSADRETPKAALQNSLFYIFYKYRDAIYIQIRGGQICKFHLLQNADYKNPLSKNFKVRGKAQNTERWIDNGGIVRPFQKTWNDYQISLSYYEVKIYFTEVVKGGGVPDCDIVVNTRERLIRKIDLTESSEELAGGLSKPLDKKFKFEVYAPFMSFNWNERYADIPIPSPDDISRIFKTFCPPGGANSYIDDAPVSWSQKIHSVAVFRGSFTGASADPKINIRLHLASMRDPSLDAGITGYNSKYRYRKSIDAPFLEMFNERLEKKLSAEPLDMAAQKRYKYVIYAEGNVGAYRGAYLFSFGSVVLWIRPYKYHLWFEPLLKNRVNCMLVKSDLSDLKKTISWLQKNDSAAARIAAGGRAFYEKCLTKEPLLRHGRDVICNINKCRFDMPKMPMIIVVPFADLRPEEKREEQLTKFIDYFIKSKLKCVIVIAEQTFPTDQFNRGMLLNLGVYWFASQYGAPASVVTHDVDMLPNKELMAYYNNSNKATSLCPYNETAKKAYGFKVGIGGAISSFQFDTFMQINGYPNDFWGWGGEDHAVAFRIKACGIKPVVVSKGDFINIDMQRLNNHKDKMRYLKKNKIQNMQWWERADADKENWKTNGYAQLRDWEACSAALVSSVPIIRVRFRLPKDKY